MKIDFNFRTGKKFRNHMKMKDLLLMIVLIIVILSAFLLNNVRSTFGFGSTMGNIPNCTNWYMRQLINTIDDRTKGQYVNNKLYNKLVNDYRVSNGGSWGPLIFLLFCVFDRAISTANVYSKDGSPFYDHTQILKVSTKAETNTGIILAPALCLYLVYVLSSGRGLAPYYSFDNVHDYDIYNGLFTYNNFGCLFKFFYTSQDSCYGGNLSARERTFADIIRIVKWLNGYDYWRNIYLDYLALIIEDVGSMPTTPTLTQLLLNKVFDKSIPSSNPGYYYYLTRYQWFEGDIRNLITNMMNNPPTDNNIFYGG